MVVDDYGHHPTEIAAVLAAAPSVRDDSGNVDGLPNVVLEASLIFLGFMSFIVWAHHMFMTGMGTRLDGQESLRTSQLLLRQDVRRAERGKAGSKSSEAAKGSSSPAGLRSAALELEAY